MALPNVLVPPEGGDILTHYKPLVGAYLTWQIVNWALAFLEMGRVMLQVCVVQLRLQLIVVVGQLQPSIVVERASRMASTSLRCISP